MKKTLIVFIVLNFILFSCSKNDSNEEPVNAVPDDQLLAQSKSATSFYQNKSDTLPIHTGSPHGNYFRVRFNPKAVSSLGTDGKLQPGSYFVDSSVVINEIYEIKGGALTRTAVMMKLPKAPNSGNGWIWGEYSPTGATITSSANKGSACTTCHSAQGNRDMVRIFEY